MQTTDKIPLLRFLRLWVAKRFKFNNNNKEVGSNHEQRISFVRPSSLTSRFNLEDQFLYLIFGVKAMENLIPFSRNLLVIREAGVHSIYKIQSPS